MMDGKRTRWDSMHSPRDKSNYSLTCFAPGNFMLGARALRRNDIFQFGLDILEGCWNSYNATPTGVSPESSFLARTLLTPVWKWQSNDTADEPHTQISRSELERFNFWTLKRDYFLRPGFIQTLTIFFLINRNDRGLFLRVSFYR